jgi:hypothetical protein
MRKLSRRFTIPMKPFMAILALGFIIASCSDNPSSTNENSPLSVTDSNPEFSMLSPLRLLKVQISGLNFQHFWYWSVFVHHF